MKVRERTALFLLRRQEDNIRSPEGPLAAAVVVERGQAALPDLRMLSTCLRDKKRSRQLP